MKSQGFSDPDGVVDTHGEGVDADGSSAGATSVPVDAIDPGPKIVRREPSPLVRSAHRYASVTSASSSHAAAVIVIGSPNASTLWIDPVEYQQQLLAAVTTLAAARMNVSVFNHQLCVLDRRLWRYAVRSISDWKNEYLPACGACSVRHECAGFFSSGVSGLHSAHIAPVSAATDRAKAARTVETQ
jgi:hypothetical protein